MNAGVIPLYRRTVTPAFDLISMPELEAYLRVEPGSDLVILNAMLNAAASLGESYVGRVFGLSTWQADFSCLTECDRPGIRLNRVPVATVSSVQRVIDGTLTAITPITFSPIYDGAIVYLPEDGITADEDATYGYRVTFTAGYAQGQLPDQIREGLKAHIGYLYENRGDVAGDFKESGIPDTAQLLYGLGPRIIAGWG